MSVGNTMFQNNGQCLNQIKLVPLLKHLLLILLLIVLFRAKVSCSPSWLQIHYVAENGLCLPSSGIVSVCHFAWPIFSICFQKQLSSIQFLLEWNMLCKPVDLECSAILLPLFFLCGKTFKNLFVPYELHQTLLFSVPTLLDRGIIQVFFSV